VTRKTLPEVRSSSLISDVARLPVKLKKYFTIGSFAELRMTCGIVES
jgi:hypothetical protein